MAGVAWLFCPANRPDRYAKAAQRADVVILDLEDAVTASERPAARAALLATPLDPSRTIVRINPARTSDHAADLDAIRGTPYTTVMLAKTESASEVTALTGLDVVALCETPRGVLHAEHIAAADNTVALMWGAEDLIAALNGVSSRTPSGGYRDVARHARASVLLAAATHHKAAVDSVYLAIADRAGLAAETDDAVASGFTAKACIHPSQVTVVRTAFTPSSERLAWARRVLDAAARHPGVFAFEGVMIDEPVLRQARHLVALRQQPATRSGQ